jgi:2,3,4,5-tetrahydropyridine-2,6-dicarboxylate N-succinyltransferase
MTIGYIIMNAYERMQQDVASFVATNEEQSAICATMAHLNNGTLRVATPSEAGWQPCHWARQAILLYFKCQTCTGHYPGVAWDKIPLKYTTPEAIANDGIRLVPPATVRYGAYVASNVVLMASYVNIGAYIGTGTLIDTWATIGSCAQIGSHVHVSGGVGIGGVLEPVQNQPTIIEDNCFIGARSEIVEGVVIGKGSVISMGVYIGQSTPIYNVQTRTVTRGQVPPYSVVIPGTLPSIDGQYATYAAIIIKTVDAKTRAKVAINQLLRCNPCERN